MARIELNYGRGTVPFEFEGGRFEVLDGEASDERPLTDAEVGALIDDPFDSQPLEEIISPGETILIVVSDATRATGSAQIVNLLVRRLIALGVAPYDLRAVFAGLDPDRVRARGGKLHDRALAHPPRAILPSHILRTCFPTPQPAE